MPPERYNELSEEGKRLCAKIVNPDGKPDDYGWKDELKTPAPFAAAEERAW